MQKLRKICKELLPFPKETTKENTFIHTTVARYKTKLRDPAKVDSFLSHWNQSATMRVQQIILRQENRYPSLDTVELIRIGLK